MTTRKEAWWVALKRHDGAYDEPEVAEVWWDGDRIEWILMPGSDIDVREEDARLIERILPPAPRQDALPAVGSFHG